MTQEESRQVDAQKNAKIAGQIEQLLRRAKRQELRGFLKSFVEDYIAIGDSPVYGGKYCGSDAEQQGARYIYEKLKELGLTAELLPFASTRFQFNDADIFYEGQTRSIKPYACMTASTPKAGLHGMLVDVHDGHRAFYEANDVEGKIVLIETKENFEDGTLAGVLQMKEAAKNGAVAIILYTNEYILDEHTIRATYSAFGPAIPYVTISSADAKLLKAEMAKNSDFSITLKVDTEFIPDGGISYDVIGEIEGRTDERIIYSAHLDHFFRCVQDNVTAVATLLGIAKELKESGYQPQRTITFVFSGSHEIGPVDTAAPDLLGAWKLLSELKPEWEGKIFADINFEYTALASKTLRGVTSYEMKGMYEAFLEYMPPEMEGLGVVQKEVSAENYYLLTWCDACPFIMKGVPVFMNDAVSEQIYEMISPYLGRDHSNMDNMDVYSSDAHLSNTLWFGCLGIFLDHQPVLVPEFIHRKAAMELTEEERRYLDEAGISYAAYDEQLARFERYGRAVSAVLAKYNETHGITAESRSINALLLKAQRLLADGTDGLTTDVPSMLSVPHKVYIEKGIAFTQAMVLLETDGYAAAYEQALRKLDMVGIEKNFSSGFAAEMKELVLGKNALWNEGKCRNFFIADDVTEEKLPDAYRENEEAIRSVLLEEAACLENVNALLLEAMIKAAGAAGRKEMLAWIEGFTKFPHRRTGTPQGLASAKYVEKTFQEIGLEDVKMETVRSIMRDCPVYSLNAGGKAIDCFFANGTNRRAETGEFHAEIADAEIVYLGTGAKEDFAGIDVEGKIVLCDVYFKEINVKTLLTWTEDAELYDPAGRTENDVTKYDIYTPNDWPYNYLYAKEKGAAGFIGILHNFMDCNYYHEDYIDIVDTGGYMDMPAVWVSREDGKRLAAECSRTHLTADLTVHTVYAEGEARIVSGRLAGKSDEMIVIHSHHDAVNRGAVQDASGMSEVFALADLFAKLPEDLREKTLLFAATDSHYTDYEGHEGFLENRRKAGEYIIADFAIEHVAQEMHLDEDNHIVLTGEPETRMVYVDEKSGLLELAKEAIERYDLDKTVIFPVRGKSGGEYTSDDVCSDAYVFNAAGIPVVSLLSAPMYLFHNSDTLDKVHQESLEQIRDLYAYMILRVLQQ